jgi:hypothetical protein
MRAFARERELFVMMTRILLTLGLVLAVVSSAAASTMEVGPGQRSPALERGSSPGRALNATIARRPRLLARFDANRDGRLDRDERARAWKDLRGRRDRPGRGLRPPLMRQRFDFNGNGQLDRWERRVVRELARLRHRERAGQRGDAGDSLLRRRSPARHGPNRGPV